MTYLYNSPSKFSTELIEGFVAAHRNVVRQVPGGVARSTKSTAGNVAVVIGGGSGHYPAFAGLVGQGFAHGAAMGNLFASPSARQIYNVARVVNNGGGVLLVFGNYAGDILHFGMARERLIAEGIPCELLPVSDDIASAQLSETNKRRGVAGDLAVFKIASAAAEAGKNLTEVLEIARRANQNTKSLGVAFSGCTLPGSSEPLFTIPEGQMAVGMGIHGEPGIKEIIIPKADDVAELLVKKLLSEKPKRAETNSPPHVAVILNGLGSVKYEEMFVVYRRIEQLLTQQNIQIIEPEVGEFVTSFNMAGLSLTLIWLDEELENYWQAPANTPAFKKGYMKLAEPLDEVDDSLIEEEAIPDASASSKQAAHQAVKLLEIMGSMLEENADHLGRIDAIAGDGDHGIGMVNGIKGAISKAQLLANQGAGIGTLLCRAGDAWSDSAGGTSGALWGVILTTIGTAFGDQKLPSKTLISQTITKANEGLMHFGKAKVGDKTMIDVLAPFSQALAENLVNGATIKQGWAKAAKVASVAAKDTANLVPKMGRARPLAEKSLGTPDAGAVSLAMIIETINRYLADERVVSEVIHE